MFHNFAKVNLNSNLFTLEFLFLTIEIFSFQPLTTRKKILN